MHSCLTVHKAYKIKYIQYNSWNLVTSYGLGCLWVKILAFHQRELENRVRVAAEAVFFFFSTRLIVFDVKNSMPPVLELEKGAMLWRGFSLIKNVARPYSRSLGSESVSVSSMASYPVRRIRIPLFNPLTFFLKC